MNDVTVVTSVTYPSPESLALVADVQYHEPYLSAALNRKFRGIVDPGFYAGFLPKPGGGMNLLITSVDGDKTAGAASVDIGEFYQVTIQQRKDISLALSAGKKYAIVLKGRYLLGEDTYQVNTASHIHAAEFVSRTYTDSYQLGDGELLVCTVNIPAGVSAITQEMIDTSERINRTIGIDISDSVTSTRSDVAASSLAVKKAYDLAKSKYTAQDASTTQKGLVQLSSATNSDSETMAATPKAVKSIKDLADTKAPIESPSLTGTPTAPTAAQGTNSTQIANTAFVKAAITALINGAPGTLDTLKEIAAAINNDPNYSTTINNALALKAPLASPALTGIPTAPTAAQGTNNTQIATTAYVRAAISALVGSSPEALDTLNELAAALGNDPNFATTMTNALAGKQPLDATLTALAGLATGANKLPYFTGTDTVSQTDLTSVGRDILAKTSVLAVIQYLGLRELGTSGEKIPLLSTANTWSARQTFNGGITGALTGNADTATKLKTARTINGVGFDGSKDITLTPENLGLTDIVSQAGNAVQRSGDKMTGELKIGTVNALRIFDEAFGLIFRRSEDFLHFIPTAEGQGENGDIGPLRPFAINLRTGAISVSHGAKIEGGLAIGATDNALGENSIVLGDNDTGFRQDGDGIISFYSNGSRIGHIDGLGLYLYKDIESNGSNFRLKSNYRHHITFANEDGSIRMFLWKDNGGDGVHINNGSDGGGDFIFKRDGGFTLGSGAQVASSGDIYGSVWENNWLSTWLHNHVVRDIRLGSIEHKNVWRDYGFGDASGYVLTAAINSNADDIVDTVARRPIQKLIGGIWYNVGSV
ncbi:tail fiber protein [Escherichia coli]|uniref:tail fiber protein n=1 Tax=Escherichia coli TaxID=562 RepID=UPI0015947CC9|nr:tail fiber protein [Escherichia coli]MCQ0258034.1 tail fiber protein [Escherichia coli]MCT2392267.1 tail fiber protein [Escherichia coli]WAT36958.1 tail fiber protein [Escherichia coli]